jgi:hypothetical protein
MFALIALVVGATFGVNPGDRASLTGRAADHVRQGTADSSAILPAASTSRVVHSEVIGYSVQHRPITVYELGNPHAAFRAVVLGSMHGYYERAGESVTRALRTMAMPAGLDLWVIDTMNPDGDALHQRGNAHGVDLNRNWPYIWIPISRAGCTAFSCHYSGPQALSEPETVAMYQFVRKIKPNRVVSLHQPLYGVDTTDGGAIDTAFRNALAHNLNLPLKAFTCFGGCHGNMTGWMTHYTATIGITVEFAQNVSSSYLTGSAASGILSALMVGVRLPPAPTVSGVVGVSGATGSTAGGNTVTVTGTGFIGVWRVTFAGLPATSIHELSATKLTVVAPKRTAGAVAVVVSASGGNSAVTPKDLYTYIAPPVITGVSPANGSSAGGTTVTITGRGFTGITTVLFGTTAGTSVSVTSATKLTVKAPKHAAGGVHVTVTGTYGTSTRIRADWYAFV